MDLRIEKWPASPRLAGLVECFWSLSAPEAGGGVLPASLPRIPPFGEVEMAIYLGEPFRFAGPGDEPRRAPRGHIAGPRGGYLDLEPGGDCDVISVRFRPGAFHFFRPGATPAFADEIVPIEECWGPAVRILDRVMLQNTNGDRIRVIEEFLIARLDGTRLHPGRTTFVTRSMEALRLHLAELVAGENTEARAGGQTPVDDLAKRMEMSRRSFQRNFSEVFGMSPLAYRNLLRFEAAVKTGLAAGPGRLTDMALDYGYYDQAHFNRDFRKYIGRAPREYFAADGLTIARIV